MADISDVMNLMVGQIAAVVYPNGTASPSIVNAAVKVYPGWPVPNVLDTDLGANGIHISVYPLTTERKLSVEMGRPYSIINPGNPTITATVSGQTVTMAGTISTPTNVYLLIDGVGYHHSVQTSDTLITIATALAAIIPNASNSGAVITLPNAIEIIARTGGIGSAARELRRQEKDFLVTIWAPTPALRESVGSALDTALSINSNISFADGQPGTMLYKQTRYDNDKTGKYLCYRLDLVYTVNYATTQIISAPQVVAPVLNTNGSSQAI